MCLLHLHYRVDVCCRLRCPYCLMMPAISLLTKISNHLELIRPDAKLQEVDERQVSSAAQQRQHSTRGTCKQIQ